MWDKGKTLILKQNIPKLPRQGGSKGCIRYVGQEGLLDYPFNFHSVYELCSIQKEVSQLVTRLYSWSGTGWRVQAYLNVSRAKRVAVVELQGRVRRIESAPHEDGNYMTNGMREHKEEGRNRVTS